MEIADSFRVSTPIDDTWKVLLDIEGIAPCLPGAQLQEVDGDEYRGIVKVKVGPITAQYKGTATLAEVDEADRRIVIDASGRDTRGQGNAKATIVVTMNDDGDGTQVDVVTDLVDHRQGRAVRPRRARRRVGEADAASSSRTSNATCSSTRRRRRHARTPAVVARATSPRRAANGSRRRPSTGPAPDRVGRGRAGRPVRRRRASPRPSAWCRSAIGVRRARSSSGACSAAARDGSPDRRRGSPPRRRRPSRIEPVFDPAGPVLGIDPGLSRCGYGVVARERGQPRAARLRRDPHAARRPAARSGCSRSTTSSRSLIADIRPSAVAVERVLFQIERAHRDVGRAGERPRARRRGARRASRSRSTARTR